MRRRWRCAWRATRAEGACPSCDSPRREMLPSRYSFTWRSMAAERKSGASVWSRGARRPIGFALITAVVAIAIVAVLATTMLVTLSGDNDQARIERTADILHRLVAAIDTARTNGSQSFRS